MKDLLRTLDEIPVVALVALAYVSLAFLTDPIDPTIAQLVRFGAARGIEVGQGEAWRLLAYAFLHGGAMHLLFNLYALIAIGPALERGIGSWRFLLVYAVSALAGGVAGTLWHSPLAPLVGGSGALFGMMGALLALQARQGREPTEFLRGQGGRQLVSMVLLNLLIGFLVPVVSNSAHLGGLFGGFFLVWFVLAPARGSRPMQGPASWAVAALFLGLGALSLRPVHRWDWQLLEWERTQSPERRQELRAAFGLALTGREDAVASDRQMAEELEELRRALRTD
jgi:rhomboid protease GluP